MFFKHYFELLYCLVLKELKIRYSYSIFGYLWALCNPIAFAIIYYFAFKVIILKSSQLKPSLFYDFFQDEIEKHKYYLFQ